jgi:hypothetical protein
MKGQFFILGAILLSVMFFIGLPSAVNLVTPDVSDMEYLSENMETEIPVVINLEPSAGTSHLEDFSSFLLSKMAERNINLSLFWVYSEPSGTDVIIRAGNYMGREESVILKVNSDERSFALSHFSTNEETFGGVGVSPTLEIGFSATKKTLDITRDKHNLYCYLSLRRGNELITREIAA